MRDAEIWRIDAITIGKAPALAQWKRWAVSFATGCNSKWQGWVIKEGAGPAAAAQRKGRSYSYNAVDRFGIARIWTCVLTASSLREAVCNDRNRMVNVTQFLPATAIVEIVHVVLYGGKPPQSWSPSLYRHRKNRTGICVQSVAVLQKPCSRFLGHFT